MGVNGAMLKSSIDLEVPLVEAHGHEKIETSVEAEPCFEDDKMIRRLTGKEIAVDQRDGDTLEPYVGMEFESEEAGRGFYIAYSTRIGFVTRVSYLSRSRSDKSVVSRALVCNKEGFRTPDWRRKGLKNRAPTRVGCKAMIALKKQSNGKWVVARFVKEHSHALSPGKPPKNRKLSIDEKIIDLSQQLLLQREQSEAYRKQLELLFKHIEEHTEGLSEKIQYIVDNVREAESEEH